jgi:glyoxylase-like metal-dependent hydrolase (beta-lactamase superfamily II)
MHTSTNKLLLRLAAGLLVMLGCWAAFPKPQGPPPLTVTKVKPDLYVIDGTSNGESDAGNISVYVTDEGVILVDDRFEQDYPQVIAAVKRITSQPIRYVINTHHHGDHTGGNAQLLPGAEILAHVNARKHMVEGKMPGPPRVVFTTESEVFLGGKEARVIYNGRAHTDGDVVVYFPAARTVAMGDLLAGSRGVTNPVVDYANGGSIRQWPATLDRVLQLDIETVIPGHGTVTNKDGLLAHRNKVDAIGDHVSKWLHEGKSNEEIRNSLVAEFDYKPINLRSVDGILAELR